MSPLFTQTSDESSHVDSPITTLMRLFHHILGYKILFSAGIFLTVVTTLAALSEPWLLGYMIDKAIVPRDWPYLQKLVLLLFFVELIRVTAFIAENYIFALIGQRVMQDLRVEVSAHLQKLPLSQYDRTPIGRIVTRITNDISSLADMFSAGFVTIIGNVLSVLGIMISLWSLNYEVGLLVAAVFPPLLTAAYIFSKKLKIAYRGARTSLAMLNAFLAENLTGIRTVHAFNRESTQMKKIDVLNESYAEAQFSTVKVFALFQPSITLATGISTALALWYGGNQVLKQEIPLGVLVTIFAYISTLFQPVREIADKWNVILSGLTSAERVFSILKWPVENVDTTRAPRRLSNLKGHIRFENVSFAYTGENWVLQDFNLEIKAGEKIGVVGPTGSGKTTLIGLLLRFYEPQKGRITIDGQDIREFDIRDWRSSLGFIQQDVFLFSGSLKDNITLGREEPHSAQVKESSFKAWPKTSQPVLHEGGMNISRGERQVVAFCRALYTDPLLWILDEATANVDSESEKGLGELLERHAQGRTTIIIAHRLSTVRNADKILLISRAKTILFSKQLKVQPVSESAPVQHCFKNETASDSEYEQKTSLH